MSEPFRNPEQSPRVRAITKLAVELQEVDDKYLAGDIDKAKWTETRLSIESRLTVAGLRLSARP